MDLLAQRRGARLREAEGADHRLAAGAAEHRYLLAHERRSSADQAAFELVHGVPFVAARAPPAGPRLAAAMGPVSAEVEIDAPRGRAFELLRDLAYRPAFTDHFIHELRLFDTQSAGVGTGARFRIEGAPPLVWMETNLIEEESPHLLLERGRGGRFNRVPVATAWELRPGPGSLITVRVSFWTEPGHPVDKLRERLGAAGARSSRNWATALRRLRDLLEAEAPPLRRVAVAGGPRYPTDL
jgi:hypothetical protein